MFTISRTKPAAFCDGIARRDFLKVGALGLAGLTLADLLRVRAQAAAWAKQAARSSASAKIEGAELVKDAAGLLLKKNYS